MVVQEVIGPVADKSITQIYQGKLDYISKLAEFV